LFVQTLHLNDGWLVEHAFGCGCSPIIPSDRWKQFSSTRFPR